jgi:hypothetical protein
MGRANARQLLVLLMMVPRRQRRTGETAALVGVIADARRDFVIEEGVDARRGGVSTAQRAGSIGAAIGSFGKGQNRVLIRRILPWKRSADRFDANHLRAVQDDGASRAITGQERRGHGDRGDGCQHR